MTVYAKYECSTINTSEVITQIKILVTYWQMVGQTDKLILKSPSPASVEVWKKFH